jgi:hypothetical protein
LVDHIDSSLKEYVQKLAEMRKNLNQEMKDIKTKIEELNGDLGPVDD